MIQYIFAILFCVLMWFVYKFKRLESLIKHIPGPKTIPLIGNGLLFVGKSPENSLAEVRRLHREYGGFFRIFFGTKLDIVIADPKDIEFILSSQNLLEKADEYNPIVEWLGSGLLLSTGNKWFARRKVLTPAFHFKILEKFVDVFDKHSSIFVESLAEFEGQEFDVFPFITLLALDVICETSMGVELRAQTNSNSEYVKAVKDITGIISTRHYNFLLRSNFIFKLSPLYQEQKRTLKILHDFTDSVIVSRRAELTKELETEDKSEADTGEKKKMALLDVLLQSTINGKPLTNMDIREEVDTFMFEGHDTTTSAIAFALYNLAKHPHVQQKAFSEIRNVFGDDENCAVTLRDLNCLNYLELVIRETLRLYPSVPYYGRKIRKDFFLNGKFIPKGASVGVTPLFVGYDPNVFPEPEMFIPERFLVGATNQNPFAYVPFSAGSRNCIGQKFAMLEVKTTISKVLRHFEINVAANFEPTLVAELILRPSNGIKLELKRRNYSFD